MTYRHFQMKEIDIEGIKKLFKSMTMFTWSTTIKSQELVIRIKMKLTINTSILNTHFQLRKNNIEGLNVKSSLIDLYKR